MNEIERGRAREEIQVWKWKKAYKQKDDDTVQ